MLKIAIIFLSISLAFAKVTKNEFKLFTKYDQTLQELPKKVTRKIDLKSNDTIWVLNLNDNSLDFQRLYLANKAEEKVFKNIIAPVINNYKLQHSIKVKDEEVNLNEDSIENEDLKDNLGIKNISEIKKEILKALNKFFTTQLNNPVSYLSDDIPASEKKSLKLYFVRPYTSLILTSGKLRYHYFISPPSPFLKWFYEEHENVMESDNGKYTEIPANVQHDFLVKLLNVLQVYTGFLV